jgi:hypothetical protein
MQLRASLSFVTTLPWLRAVCGLRQAPDCRVVSGQEPEVCTLLVLDEGPNAILNYLYSVLESETRLAAAALGLDPGLGDVAR